MAKRQRSDPLLLGSLQRRIEGKPRRRRVVVEIEDPPGRFAGIRGTLLLLAVVLGLLVMVSLLGR